MDEDGETQHYLTVPIPPLCLKQLLVISTVPLLSMLLQVTLDGMELLWGSRSKSSLAIDIDQLLFGSGEA